MLKHVRGPAMTAFYGANAYLSQPVWKGVLIMAAMIISAALGMALVQRGAWVLAGLGGLGMIGFCYLNPVAAIAAVAFLGPFNALYRQLELPLGLNLVQLLTFAGLTSLIAKRVMNQNQYLFQTTPFDKPILGYVLITIYGLLLSSMNLTELISSAISRFGQVAIFYFVANSVEKERDFERIIYILLISSTLAVAITGWAFVSGYETLWGVDLERGAKLTGFSTNTTSMSQLYAVVSPIAVALLLVPNNSRIKRLFLILSIIAGIMFFGLSQTRAATIGFLLGSAVVIWFEKGQGLRVLVVLGLVVLATGFLLEQWGYLADFLWSLGLEGKLPGMDERLYNLYPYAIRFVLTHPLGVGFGDFRLITQTEWGYRQGPHNTIFAFGISSGWPGVAGIVWLIVAQFKTMIRAIDQINGKRKSYLLGLLAANASFWLGAMFHSYMGWYVIWLVWGLSAIALRIYLSQGLEGGSNYDKGGLIYD